MPDTATIAPPRAKSFLTDAQKEQFLSRGFVVIKNAFSREQAKPYLDTLWPRLVMKEDDRSTWHKAFLQLPPTRKIKLQEFAPQAWGAMLEILGGEDRLWHCGWADHFRVNLGNEDDPQNWKTPAEAAALAYNWKNPSAGWHADGGWYVRFLDSFEVGLQTLAVWSDSQPRGGGTFVACDSVGPVARLLAEHPEGLRSGGFGSDLSKLLDQCKDFVEVTGEVGDVYLIHPFILHAGSRNALRIPRIITNTHARLSQPLKFNRENPEDFSLVEKAILRGLGVDRLDFVPKGERQSMKWNPVKHVKEYLSYTDQLHGNPDEPREMESEMMR